jgi:hypothetical protein
VIYPETVTRLRAPMVADRNNHLARDWSTATEVDIVGVQVQPTGSSEPVEVGRASVVTRFRLIVAPGNDVDLVRTDRIRWNGVVHEVDGDPERHLRPSTGTLHHVEATLKVVAG